MHEAHTDPKLLISYNLPLWLHKILDPLYFQLLSEKLIINATLSFVANPLLTFHSVQILVPILANPSA